MKGAQNTFGPPDPNAPKPELVKGPEYDKLSAYFNLDNGTGKIRGVYMQGNGNVRPIFNASLTPLEPWSSSVMPTTAARVEIASLRATRRLPHMAASVANFGRWTPPLSTMGTKAIR